MRNKRDLTLVCGGVVISVFGSALTVIALMLALRSLGPLAVAAMLIAEAIPISLCAPLAGLLVDLLPNRRLMIIAEVLQGGAVLLMAHCLHNLPAILGLLVLMGFGTAVARPAGSALIPLVTGEDAATRGYAWLSTGSSMGMLLGCALGGLLVATVGARNALSIDGVTYLVQAGLLLLVRAERRPRRHESGSGRQITAGLRYLFTDRVLALVVGGLAVTVMAVVMIDVNEVFFVTTVLRGGGVTLGVLQACWMAGMLIGARFAARLRGQRVLVLGLCVANCVMGVAVLGPAAVPLAVVTGLAFAIGGMTNAVQNVCQQALVRSRTPEHLRGRVFAASGSLLMMANTVGMLIGAVVIGVVGARWPFAIAAGATVLAGGAALLATRGLTTSSSPTTQRAAQMG